MHRGLLELGPHGVSGVTAERHTGAWPWAYGRGRWTERRAHQPLANLAVVIFYRNRGKRKIQQR